MSVSILEKTIMEKTIMEKAETDMSALPKIACLTVTYNRPHLLPNLIESFNRQDYPISKRELIILDDIGQYPTQPSGENWQVVSVKNRFETLSAKRNALAAMTSNDVDAIAIWDDDDTFLPWCLLSHAWALRQGPVSHPKLVLADKGAGGFSIKSTGQRMYQATQAIDRDLFLDIGGFPRGNSGVDQQLVGLLAKEVGDVGFVDPTSQFPPWFVYGWSDTQSPHLSTLGKEGYNKPALVEAGVKGSQNQQSDLIPKWRRSWMAEVRASLGIPVGVGTYDLPGWWSENRYIAAGAPATI